MEDDFDDYEDTDGVDALDQGIYISSDEDMATTPPIAKRKCLNEIQTNWTSEQIDAIVSVVDDQKNTFLTGPAGSGKTTLLEEIVERLVAKHGHSHVFVTAMTGLAAINLHGTTLHSFIGAGLATEDKKQLADNIGKNRITKLRWTSCEVLIVDEVSMMTVDLFEKMDYIARVVRKNSRPFGGIQLLLVGDFFQLPPIENKKVLDRRHDRYIFSSPLFIKTIECNIALKKIYRQKDDVEFSNMLNEFRIGVVTDEAYAKLCSRIVPRKNLSELGSKNCTYLFSHKTTVQTHNEKELQKLNGETFECKAKDDCLPTNSAENALKTLKKNCPASETLLLRTGAFVVLLKNLNPDIGLVNGVRGFVVATHEKFGYSEDGKFSPEGEDEDAPQPPRKIIVLKPPPYLKEHGICLYATYGTRAVTVKFENGIIATISPQRWSIDAKKDNGISYNIAWRDQLPFSLAWAVSIHKSQGMTLTSVCVCLDKVFEEGQAYVALSRVTSLSGLYIVSKFERSVISASKEVVDFYKKNNLL